MDWNPHDFEDTDPSSAEWQSFRREMGWHLPPAAAAIWLFGAMCNAGGRLVLAATGALAAKVRQRLTRTAQPARTVPTSNVVTTP